MRGSRTRLPAAVAATVSLVLVVGLALGLTSAFASSSAASPAPGKVILRVGWLSEPDNLNPFIGWATSSYMVWHLNYDLLVGYDADQVPRPELATSWEHSDNGLVWTFHLRHGVVWQDGTPFTAKDVAWEFNYIIRNKMLAFSGFLPRVTRVEAVDPYTVKFYCSKPEANIVRLWIPILPAHIWSKISPNAAGMSFINNPPIIGTGPFETVKFVKGQYVSMVANKHYWGGPPKIDEVIFADYSDAQSMVDDLKLGTIAGAVGILPAAMNSLSHTPGLKTATQDYTLFDELMFNVKTGRSLGNPVLLDRRFRQALTWAIDRQAICSLAYDGYAVPGSTVILGVKDRLPDGTILNYHYAPTPSETFGFDIGKANHLLDTAGYKTGPDGTRLDKHGKAIVLRLWAFSDSPSSQTAAKMMAGWFAKLGLKIQYLSLSEASANAALYNMQGTAYVPNYDMMIWPDITQYSDAGDMMTCYTTAQWGQYNVCFYSSKQYDALFSRQVGEMDPVKRQELIWQMQRILYRDCVYVVYAYHGAMEAHNAANWAGWVLAPPKIGSALGVVANNMDSYRLVGPAPHVLASTRGSSYAAWIAIAVVVVVLGTVVAWLLRRRRPRDVEQ